MGYISLSTVLMAFLAVEAGALFSDSVLVIALSTALIAVLLGVLIYQNYNKKKSEYLERSYESLFENMKEGVAWHEIICDGNGKPVDYKFIKVNHAFEQITGLNGADIIGRTVMEVLPATESYWIEKYGIVALTGETMNFENYSRELMKHFNVNVYSPEHGIFITVFSDITNQVLAREKTEKDRKILETILEDTMSGYWDWDVVNDTEYYSPAFMKMFGFEPGELANKPETWRNLIFKEDLPKVVETYRRHVESKGEIPCYNEVRYRHKEGKTVWVICSGRVVEWTDDGKPKRMIGCHIDVTPLKGLEDQVRKKWAQFMSTLNSLGDAVISSDMEGNVELMNPVAEKLTGWSYESAKGRPFRDVFKTIDEYTRQTIQSPIKKAFETGETIEMANHLLIRKNGLEMAVEDSCAPIIDKHGEMLGAVIVFRDYTEQKDKMEKIKYLSYHDQLTGLYNRRYFEEELKRLDTERNLPLTLAIIDVNGLKLANDAFGHDMGDTLLKHVTDVIKGLCRMDDIIARVGGDEFTILLPKTGSNEGERLVERIYKSLGREQFKNMVVSISVGLATKTYKDEDVREVQKRAEEQMYRKKLTESQSMRSETIKVILNTLNETSETERIHSENVSKIAKAIAIEVGMDQELIEETAIAGLMHDIGKIAVDNSVLNKAMELTDLEYEEIKRHSEIGYHILKSVDAYTNLADYALSHHERWDGKGYPRGLKGEEIPLIARIISVADALEAMLSERSYREAGTFEKGIQELINCSGEHFDPAIIGICVENSWKEVKKVLNRKETH